MGGHPCGGRLTRARTAHTEPFRAGNAREGGAPARVPPSLREPESPSAGEGGRVTGGGPEVQRWSLPVDRTAARPASRRATGMRNGEQET
ncbi:hypothetical protein GCM10010238_04470 [Streptomyces griseoviridis]|uniref:Uncharacterized protein n=1 Tax=Streptomyces griseoviridis TaxID=45398 RepID=A0A918G7C8_STRGD|nr:hypothetical protein GCM10010238_04470 [Streptomyces niveoruber]